MTRFFLQETFGHCSEGLELNGDWPDLLQTYHHAFFVSKNSLVKRVKRVSPEDIQLKNEAAVQVRLLFFH